MNTQVFIPEIITDKTNLLIVIINNCGNVEYISPAVEQVLGFSIHELYGNAWWEKTRNSENAEIIKRKVLGLFNDDAGTSVYEHELFSKNGNKKWIRWEISKISDQQLIGIGQDITERKQIENSLREQILLLNDKNKNITDSILYAKRLQDFILKNADKLHEAFESFILYLPKDILSGDYYTFYDLDDKYIIALADCTGHGVPGAMMSFLSHSIIRDVIYSGNYNTPADVLYKIDKGLSDLLNNNSNDYISDGMDISIVFIDKKRSKLEFAGAYRPVFINLNGNFELLDFAKSSIGFSDFEKNFFTVERNIQKGDIVYLFSDGYADQFGGQRNKKLKNKNFLEILKELQDMPMDEQSAFLEYTLNNWKQQNDQTDDITVIGIKV